MLYSINFRSLAPAENKAKRLSLVSHTTKTIHHRHHHHHLKVFYLKCCILNNILILNILWLQMTSSKFFVENNFTKYDSWKSLRQFLLLSENFERYFFHLFLVLQTNKDRFTIKIIKERTWSVWVIYHLMKGLYNIIIYVYSSQ